MSKLVLIFAVIFMLGAGCQNSVPVAPPPRLVTFNTPEEIYAFGSRSVGLAFYFPETYASHVEYQMLQQGSGYDIRINKGQIGQIRIFEAILQPVTTGFSGDEFIDVPEDKRADAIDRAFPKETLRKKWGSKEYLVELYYRKDDVATKRELEAILNTVRATK